MSQYGDGEDDTRSISLTPQTEERVYQMIKNDVSGFDEKSTQSKINTFKNLVTHTKFISLSSKASTEENGTKTLTSLKGIMRLLGPTVSQIIIIDFNLLNYGLSKKEEKVLEEKRHLEILKVSSQEIKAPNEALLAAKAKQRLERAKLDLQQSEEFIQSDKPKRKQMIDDLILEHESIERDIFIDSFEKYQLAITAKNEAIISGLDQKLTRDKLLAEEIFLSGLIEVIALLLSSLKNHVATCPMLVQLLKADVSVQLSTEEFGSERKHTITNPYDNNNISGIFHILQNEFYSGSLVSYASLLLSTINYRITAEESNNDPEAAIRGVEALVETWLARDAFKRMTMDWFFTFVLINSLHADSDIRSLVTREINRFMKTQEGQEVSEESMITLNHAKDIIKLEMSGKRLNTISADGGRKSSNTSSTGSTNNWNRGRTNKPSLGSAEQAYVADEAHAKLPGSPGVPIKRIFTGQITASMQKQYFNPTATTNGKDSGRVLNYIAVPKEEDICGICYGQNSDPSKCQKVHIKDTGKCYAKQCKICKYYGHPATYCMHKTDVNGKSTA